MITKLVKGITIACKNSCFVAFPLGTNVNINDWNQLSEWKHIFAQGAKTGLDISFGLWEVWHSFAFMKYHTWLRILAVILKAAYISGQTISLSCSYLFYCNLKFRLWQSHIILKRGAVGSTGLRRLSQGRWCIYHLIITISDSGGLELPVRWKGCLARLCISLTHTTCLSLMKCDSQAASDATRRDKTRH